MKIRVDFGEIRPSLARCKRLSRAIGTINPRPAGWHNDLIQHGKKLLAHWLGWHARPQREFNRSVVRSVDILAPSIVKVQVNLRLRAMDERLTQLKRDSTALASSLQKGAQVLAKLEALANSHKNGSPRTTLASIEGQVSHPSIWLFDFDELRRAAAALGMHGSSIEVTPQSSRSYNAFVQPSNKLLGRSLAWYTQPQREFNVSAVRCLDSIANVIEDLQTALRATDERLPQVERSNVALAFSLQKCMEILATLESPANPAKQVDLETALTSMGGDVSKPRPVPDAWCFPVAELRIAVAAMERPRNAIGTIKALPSGQYNSPNQRLEKLVSRLLDKGAWPLPDFNDFVDRSVDEIACAVENICTVMISLDERLVQAENRNTILAESIQEQLGRLHERVKMTVDLEHTSSPETPFGRDRDEQAREISQFYTDTGLGNARTAYVIGLFGSGRWYINTLMLHIGERAQYFRDGMRLHRGPTSMIYSGHATRRYTSRGQSVPVIMDHILEAVRLGFADVIFIYRHPLDSLLTNWVYWRTYARHNRGSWGISAAYKQTDDLCADVERNFSEFMSFAQGDPNFFAAELGPRFLSFQEFVEETELHLQSATLSLRLEDFIVDPVREFSKIAEVMSVDLNLDRLRIAPPRTQPYRYLDVKDKVPLFRSFVDGLNDEIRKRIEKFGYNLG